MNDMINVDDKHGWAEQPQWLLDGFKEVILDCELIGLPLKGYLFTWRIKDNGVVMLEERLDKAVVTPF